MKKQVGTTKCSAIEQLNEAAEKYAKNKSSLLRLDKDSFIAVNLSYIQGALSPEAANGCNKHVEKAKIEFAIDFISEEINLCQTFNERDKLIDLKEKLSEKLKQYENNN